MTATTAYIPRVSASLLPVKVNSPECKHGHVHTLMSATVFQPFAAGAASNDQSVRQNSLVDTDFGLTRSSVSAPAAAASLQD